MDSPEGLASFWANFTGIWRSPSEAKAETDNVSAAEIDPMEVRRAFMTLKQMRIYKTPETVHLWLEWYVKAGGLNRSEFITQFSRSWDRYTPIAARAFAGKLQEEESQWDRILNERYRREAGKTMPIIDFHRGMGEEELQRLRESFLASLPDVDAIREAVDAVPLDANLDDDGEYIRWLDTLAHAVPVLGPFNVIPDSEWQLGFVRLAREDFRGDMDAFAEATRDYVVAMMETYKRWIEEGEIAGPRINTFYWRFFAENFDLAPGIKEAQESQGNE